MIRSISLSKSSELSEFEKFNLSLDDGKEFIDSKILDFISGNTLQNRRRKLTSIVAEMVVGTTLKTDDLFQKIPIKGQPQGSVFVAKASSTNAPNMTSEGIEISGSTTQDATISEFREQTRAENAIGGPMSKKTKRMKRAAQREVPIREEFF